MNVKVYKISANLVHRELRNATFEGKKNANLNYISGLWGLVTKTAAKKWEIGTKRYALPDFILPPPLLEALHFRAGGVGHRFQAPDPAEAARRRPDSMNHDFSCCSLDGVQKGVKIKVCPKYRYHKMACSMVYSKSLLMNVYKTWFIGNNNPILPLILCMIWFKFSLIHGQFSSYILSLTS